MIDEVLFLRHGRTAYNLARRLQGQIDIPLDIVGRWQADQSAYELAKTYYWAKVAHLAEHNDQLAQPAYGNAHLADVDEINNAPAAARRAVSGLEGWIECFEHARLAGRVFAGGVDAPGSVAGHPALQEAYTLGKNA